MLDLTRVGVLGVGWGAFTAHAVAGGRFEQLPKGEGRDERIVAIVAISPQGPGSISDHWNINSYGYGAFDESSTNNTWNPVNTFVFFFESYTIHT